MVGNQQKQAPRQTDPWCGKVTNIQALGRQEQGGCEFKTSLVTEQAMVFKTNSNTNTHRSRNLQRQEPKRWGEERLNSSTEKI